MERCKCIAVSTNKQCTRAAVDKSKFCSQHKKKCKTVHINKETPAMNTRSMKRKRDNMKIYARKKSLTESKKIDNKLDNKLDNDMDNLINLFSNWKVNKIEKKLKSTEKSIDKSIKEQRKLNSKIKSTPQKSISSSHELTSWEKSIYKPVKRAKSLNDLKDKSSKMVNKLYEMYNIGRRIREVITENQKKIKKIPPPIAPKPSKKTKKVTLLEQIQTGKRLKKTNKKSKNSSQNSNSISKILTARRKAMSSSNDKKSSDW